MRGGDLTKMPGLPLVVRESSYVFSHSRQVDQMCRQDSRTHMPQGNVVATEESLSVYCKPVEFYNILQRRGSQNPAFLQRCLEYKIEAKRKKRIQLTVSISCVETNGQHLPKMMPSYVILARHFISSTSEEHSSVYKPLCACKLIDFRESGSQGQLEASFIIPKLSKLLADGKCNNLVILALSFGEGRTIPSELTELCSTLLATSDHDEICLWGCLPIERLSANWKTSLSFTLGNRAEVLTPLSMHPGILKVDRNRIYFQKPLNSGNMSSNAVRLNIYAQELKGKEKSPYDYYDFSRVPTSSVARIIQLRAGNVIFNYRYCNNSLQKTEVTEEFTCPFCLVQCGSFKGLRCHLTCSHDLFNFEFWVTEEYQAVNVSVKINMWSSEVVSGGLDPKFQTFFMSSGRRKRKRTGSGFSAANHIHPNILVSSTGRNGLEKDVGISCSDMPSLAATEKAGSSLKRSRNDVGSSKGEKTLKKLCRSVEGNPDKCLLQCAEPTDCNENSVHGAVERYGNHDLEQQPLANNLTGTKILRFAKTRKLRAECSDCKNRTLLQEREFFHSHRAQPMVLEQVLSDQDSEDEVDDDIADFEDQRMLDDFLDVTKDEKHIMHLWNCFVRRQRVLADGHAPWACEAFTKLHGRSLVGTPALIWCWRLLLIKLWNHCLIDGRTMNNCSLILEGYQKETASSEGS